MTLWPLWIITAVIAIAKSNDDRWPSKFPLNLRQFIDKQELCEFGYADCDNYVTMGLAKSRNVNDVYEVNSDDETNLENVLGNVIDVGEKRSNRRPDCDCQLSSEFIDLGASTYPRFVRNVTCDGHSRCQHAPRRGLHCLPIHYDVNILTKRSNPRAPHELSEAFHVPADLRSYWQPETKQVVVGCICGHLNNQ